MVGTFCVAAVVVYREWWQLAVPVALVMGGPVFFGTVLVHELGHTFAARQMGGQVRHIVLWTLGGLPGISHTSGALLVAATYHLWALDLSLIHISEPTRPY